MKSILSGYARQRVGGIGAYVPGRTIEGYTKLASNENNYGPSPGVIDAICRAASRVNIYPHKENEVREKIAKYCKVGSGNIIPGNGSDELLDLIVKTFNGPCLSFYPSYSWYGIGANILGEEYLDVALEEDFTLSTEKFIDRSKKANILILCNPNNPTGTLVSVDQMKGILDEDKITIVDEAYYEFHGKSAASLLKKYDNLIVLRTFAKAFALAGLRIGYGIANSDLIDLLHRVKPPFNVNSLAQEAAIAALDDLAYMESTVNRIIKDRELLFEGLSQRFKSFRSHANFVLIDTTPISSGDLYERLIKKKIIVRNLGRFRGFGGEYCRISVGTTDENRRLLEALEEL
jgi:histidinol-phosphate aminotransferase